MVMRKIIGRGDNEITVEPLVCYFLAFHYPASDTGENSVLGVGDTHYRGGQSGKYFHLFPARLHVGG